MRWGRFPSLAILIVSAAVMGAALTHVWVHLQLISMGYDLSRQMDLRRKLSETQQQLTLELRTRMDLSAVERMARERYHMQPPAPSAIRVIKEKGKP